MVVGAGSEYEAPDQDERARYELMIWMERLVINSSHALHCGWNSDGECIDDGAVVRGGRGRREEGKVIPKHAKSAQLEFLGRKIKPGKKRVDMRQAGLGYCARTPEQTDLCEA